MKTIQISEETFERLKDQLLGAKEINALQDMVGQSFFFRTVTYHMVGRVVKVLESIVMLEEASWVADSGRFMQAIRDGTLNEVEPVGTWFVNLDATSDFGPWVHPLPKVQK